MYTPFLSKIPSVYSYNATRRCNNSEEYGIVKVSDPNFKSTPEYSKKGNSKSGSGRSCCHPKDQDPLRDLHFNILLKW